MGLDQNAFAHKGALPQPTDFEPKPEEISELFYWRKHADLEGWMEKLYREKGGKEEVFNVATVELTMQDIDRLERDVLADSLPHTEGFFFGKSHPEDKEATLKFIGLARETLRGGDSVFYTSWW